MSQHAITWAFPQPGRVIRHAFGQLRVAQFGTEEEKAEQLGDINPADLPRPWDPPTCPVALRKHVWAWLDRVAAWLNHEYVWQADRVIPSCWPAHPHIARDLAVVASLRYNAGFAFQPDTLEDWHRYALPAFLDRMATRLGPNACPPGKHTDWPSSGRFRDFESAGAVERRGRAFDADQNYSAPPRLGKPEGAPSGHVNGGSARSPQLTVITSTPAQEKEDRRDE